MTFFGSLTETFQNAPFIETTSMHGLTFLSEVLA
jgi:hypothetical protein